MGVEGRRGTKRGLTRWEENVRGRGAEGGDCSDFMLLNETGTDS